MAFGVFAVRCDICSHFCISTIECDQEGNWPIEYAGAECPECGNMSMYPEGGDESCVDDDDLVVG